MTAPAVLHIQSRIAQIENRLGISPRIADATGSFADTLSAALGSSSNTASASYAGASGGTVSGSEVVSSAKKYLGVPYVYGGNDPETGLDCSSLVQQAFKDLGISLPRVAADQARQGTKVASLAQAKPGDLVAFGSPVDHIGIYAGDNKMIVAPRKGEVVKIQDVYTTPTAIRRIIPDAGSSLGAAAATFNALNASGFGALTSQYNDLFSTAGAKHGVSPRLLAAVAKAESNFNSRAVSGAGAQGLMQLMPGTARGLGVKNSFDPAQAVDGAAKMLSGLIRQFGSTNLALAAYNAGPGAVQKYNGIPPYSETQNYVKKVLNFVQQGAGS